MEPLGRRARIAIVGAGRLGTALGIALDRAQYNVVCCASRSERSAQRLAEQLPSALATRSASEAVMRADVVFLTVPDDAIEAVDTQVEWSDRHLAVHCSGALPAAALASAVAAGARVAGFHPLQTFADRETAPDNLPGSTIGIEADDATWFFLAAVARDLEATPLRITREQRALYHAGSVLVSNGTVGLVALAAHFWEMIGFERDAAVQALLPLVEGTLRNLQNLGVPAALTGPVLRGDLGTVYKHVAALAEAPRERAVYRAVSDWLIELAMERGTITADQAIALRAAIVADSTYEWRRALPRRRSRIVRPPPRPQIDG